MNNKTFSNTFPKKQSGATLVTALIFLILMTIVSVSAAKIATLDAVMAGNYQQIMLVFQQTDKTLKGFTNPLLVTRAIGDNQGINKDWTVTLAGVVNATREITNRSVEYPCKKEGLATSVGSDTAPSCYVIDLSAEDVLENTNFKDKHFRGVGKSLPNTSNYQ